MPRAGLSPRQLLAHAEITLLEIEPTLSSLERQATGGGLSPAVVGLVATLRLLVGQMATFRDELTWRTGLGEPLGWIEDMDLQRACRRFDVMTTGLWKMTNTVQVLMKDVGHA